MTGSVTPERLASVSVLEGAPLEDLAAAASRMWCRHAFPGEVLVEEGEPGETFGLVLEGEVTVSRRTPAGAHELDRAGAGSMLGELAVLRQTPRTATLTATTACLLAVGDRAALETLLHIPVVFERVRLLASRRLARDLRPVRAGLKDGSAVMVRPLLPQDRQAFGVEVHRLSEASRRLRFFSPAAPSERMIDYLIDIDYVDHFAWLAVDAAPPHHGLATVRFVRTPEPGTAEVAFGTAEGYHGRGLGTLLLGAIGVAACEGGIGTLVAHVMEENKAMRAVFAKASPVVTFDEPGILQVKLASEAAAATLPEPLRRELSGAVRDIVTAASLALSHPVGEEGGPGGR